MDIKCVCVNDEFQAAAASCLLTTCTSDDLGQALALEKTQCPAGGSGALSWLPRVVLALILAQRRPLSRHRPLRAPIRPRNQSRSPRRPPFTGIAARARPLHRFTRPNRVRPWVNPNQRPSHSLRSRTRSRSRLPPLPWPALRPRTRLTTPRIAPPTSTPAASAASFPGSRRPRPPSCRRPTPEARRRNPWPRLRHCIHSWCSSLRSSEVVSRFEFVLDRIRCAWTLAIV